MRGRGERCEIRRVRLGLVLVLPLLNLITLGLMLSHVVLFWLKPDLTVAQRQDFETRLRALGSIPGVVAFHVGTVATTDRPVIDRSYSFGLNLIFPDMAAHDAYQTHPTHQAFVDNCKTLWTKVVIYDFA